MESPTESEDADGNAMCTNCGLETCVTGFEYCLLCTREAFELYKQRKKKSSRPKPRKNVRLINGIEKAMFTSLSKEEINFMSELLPEEIRGDGKEMLEVIRGYKMSGNPKNKSRKKEEVAARLIHLLYGFKTPAIIITENEWIGPVMLKEHIESYSDELEALHPQNVNYLSQGLHMIQKLLQAKRVKNVKRTSKNHESVVCMKVDKQYMKISKKLSLNKEGEDVEEEEDVEDNNFDIDEEDEEEAGSRREDYLHGESSSVENGLGVDNSRQNNWETSSHHSDSGGGNKYSSGSQESPGGRGVPSADTAAPAGARMGAALGHLHTQAATVHQPADPMEEGAYGATYQPYQQPPRVTMEPSRRGRGQGGFQGLVNSPREPMLDVAPPAIVPLECALPKYALNMKTNDFPTLPGANTIDNAVKPGATPWESRLGHFVEKQKETILVLSETDNMINEDNLSRFMPQKSSPQNFITQKGLRLHLPIKRKSTDTIEPSSSKWNESPPRTSTPTLNFNIGGNQNTMEVSATINGSLTSDFVSQDTGHQIYSHPVAPQVDDGMLVKRSSFVQVQSKSAMDINSDCTLRSSGALGSVQVMVPVATTGLASGMEKINQPVEESGCERALYSNNKSQALRTIAFEAGDYFETKEFGDEGGDSSEMESRATEEKPFKFPKHLSSVSKISNNINKVVKPPKTNTNGARDGRAIRRHGGKGGGGRGLAEPILEDFQKQGPLSIFSSKAENTFNIKPANSRVAESADSPLKVVSQNKAVTEASEDINEDRIKGPGSSEMVTSSIHDTNIKKELILGSKGKKSKGTTSLLRLYEMDTNPERKKFLDQLTDYMEKRSTPISRCPIIGQKPVDLFRLYLNIKRRGGFTKCNTSWKIIAAEIGLTQTANVAYSLKKIYEKDLLPFEDINPDCLNPDDLSSEEPQVNLMETVSPSIPTDGQAKETASHGHLIKYVGDTSLDTNKILNLSQY